MPRSASPGPTSRSASSAGMPPGSSARASTSSTASSVSPGGARIPRRRRSTPRTGRGRSRSRRPARRRDSSPVGPELDDAVEHHRPHPLREQVGVHLPDHGAVAEAEVAELLVAHGGPHDVHVAGHVRGADVRRTSPYLVAAVLDVVVADRRGRPPRRRRPRRSGPRRTSSSAGTPQVIGGAAAHAARVEPDDVEVLGDLLGERRTGSSSAYSAALGTGPAGVDEQRADPVAAGRRAGDVQLDLSPSGSS